MSVSFFWSFDLPPRPINAQFDPENRPKHVNLPIPKTRNGCRDANLPIPKTRNGRRDANLPIPKIRNGCRDATLPIPKTRNGRRDAVLPIPKPQKGTPEASRADPKTRNGPPDAVWPAAKTRKPGRDPNDPFERRAVPRFLSSHVLGSPHLGGTPAGLPHPAKEAEKDAFLPPTPAQTHLR